MEKLTEQINLLLSEKNNKSNKDIAGEIAVAAANFAFEKLEMGALEQSMTIWSFIRQITKIEMPMKITDFTYILEPGNEEYFGNYVTQPAYDMILDAAKQELSKLENKTTELAEEEKMQISWLKSICEGTLPYGFQLQK